MHVNLLTEGDGHGRRHRYTAVERGTQREMYREREGNTERETLMEGDMDTQLQKGRYTAVQRGRE